MDLPLFPLNTVLFPGAKMPLHIFEPRYRLMIGHCIEQEAPFGIVLIRSGAEVGGGAEPFTIGVTARITRVERMDDGRMNILAIGQDRFRILETSSAQPYLTGEVELLNQQDADAPSAEVAAEAVRGRYLRFVQLGLALRGEWTLRAAAPRQPAHLADHVAARLPVEMQTKQRLLEELNVPRRLAAVSRILDVAIEELEPRVRALQARRYSGFGARN